MKAEKLYYTALIAYIWYEAPEEEQNFSMLIDLVDASEATGTLETYLPEEETYLQEKAQQEQINNQLVTQGREVVQEQNALVSEEKVLSELEKEPVIEPETVHITFTVAECGEFHNMGEYHEDIETIEEAMKLYNAIDPSWMHGIPSIGVNMHIEDSERQAKELLVKLAEYKPLAKIEELEEQNYNMIDNVLNNGVEKFNREEEKKEQQEKPQARSSLKERLAAKQKEAAQGNNKDMKEQEKSKNSHREMQDDE